MRHFIAATILIISMVLTITVFATVVRQPHYLQPDIGRFLVSYGDLNAQQSFCQSDATSRECEYAAARVCVSKGYNSGLGLVETYGDRGEIICTSTNASNILHTTFNELSTHHPACNTYQRVRWDVCQAAVARYCVANNYAGGGYGPINYNTNEAQVTCVRAEYATPLGAPYTDLAKYDSNCDGPSKMSSTSCLRSADHVCQRNGFSGSQRIAETSEKDVLIYCLKERNQITTVTYDPRLENETFPDDHLLSFINLSSSITRDIGEDTGGLAQLPGHPDHFLARKRNTDDDHWSLELVKVDWPTTRRLPSKTIRIETILQTPFDVTDPIHGNISVYTALDASVIEHEGRYWIAFECQAFKGLKTNLHPSTSTCMVAYTLEGGVDLSKFQILISGRNYNPSPSNHYDVVSASVPTLFKHQGKPYLYWVAVNEERTNLATVGVWQDLQTRGVELDWDYTRKNFVVKNHTGGVFESNHPTSVVIVDSTFKPDPNATWSANKAADLTDVYSDGKHIYAAISVGENCIEPNSNGPLYVHDDNCYRTAIAKSNSPLKRQSFNTGQISILPDQSMGYVTFIERPKHQRVRDTRVSTAPSDYGKTLLVTGYVNETYHTAKPIGRFIHPLRAAVEAAPETAGLCDDKPLEWLAPNSICAPTCSALGGRLISENQTCDILNSGQSRWYRAGEVLKSGNCCVIGD